MDDGFLIAHLKNNQMRVGIMMGIKSPLTYVRQSIESILSQSYKEFQFLIIDDAGPLDTSCYLQSIRDSRVKIIRHETCVGIPSTLNEAIKELWSAGAELIFNMDADDIADKRRVERQLSFMKAHPDVTFLGTQTGFIDSNGNEIKRKHRVPLTSEAICYQMLWSCPFIHPTVAFRAEPILSLGGYDTSFLTATDYNLFTRLVPNVKTANLNEKLLYYRQHDS